MAFITCVADRGEYSRLQESITSLRRQGLEVRADAIFNEGNRYSCPEALNQGWSRAAEELLVFCHEDVLFPVDWLGRLLAEMERVEQFPEPWAVLGPMGRVGKRYHGHASGPDGQASYHGPLPAKVQTLDELCLVVRRDLPLRFDERLGGYHLYGVDLCLQAVEAGYACFAVDAPCRHESTTRHRPPEYHAVKRKLQRKWMFRRRKVGRSVGTTCGRIRFGVFEGWL